MAEAVAVAVAALFGVLGYLGRGWLEKSRRRLEFDSTLIVEEGPHWTQYFAKVRNKGRSPSTQTFGLITAESLTAHDAIARRSIINASEVGLTAEKLGTRDAREFFLLASDNFCPVVDELLCWSRFRAPVSVDIPGTGSSNLVLFRHFQESSENPDKPSQIQIPSEDGWNTLRIALHDEERLTFLIRAVNEAGASATAQLIIEPDRDKPSQIEVEIAPDSRSRM